MSARPDECSAAGVSEKRVQALSRRLAACAKEAKDIGVFIFAGSGSATIRAHVPDIRGGALIVAEIGGPTGLWDGGDGATHWREDGLLVGEDA